MGLGGVYPTPFPKMIVNFYLVGGDLKSDTLKSD